MKRLMFTLILGAATAAAQEDLKQTITAIYTATFASMREAKSVSDLRRLMDAIDVPDWVSTLPSGETLTRADALRLMEGLLEVPSEKRPSPTIDIIYFRENAWNAQAVYWVYRREQNKVVGSLARDTWVRTAPGWRRIRHEKFFPDRPLQEDGKAVILPKL
ncbi:MAG: hypothetical protein K2X03_23245 [Bryobacteraceae bacterium]|nr:hypothetical protein [Bryobacteraceae bacterium]